MEPNTMNITADTGEVLFEIGEVSSSKKKHFDENLDIDLTGNTFIDTYRKVDDYFQSMSKIKMKEKMAFFQLLSVTLNAGVPLIKALRVIANEMTNVRLKKVTLGLARSIEQGKKLSQAMEDYPRIFSRSQIGMVHAGEISGKLNEIFLKINRETEKNTKLVSRVKGAMIYPIIVLIILALVIGVMMVMVIPKIGKVFTDAGMDLPPLTNALIVFSDFMQHNYVLMIGAAIASYFLLGVAKRTQIGRWYWDKMIISLPVFGKFMRMICIAKFARTLSALISSGVSIVKALQINAEAVGNEVYKRRILISADDVAKGIPLGENLSGSNDLFPPVVVSMVAVGEQSAELSTVMDKIADYYDNEIDVMTQNISKLLEPFILIILGLSVGTIVFAIMQPIMSLTSLADNL